MDNDELYFKRVAYLLLDDWIISKASLYDEEGIEGWVWERDGNEYAEMGDWCELPTMPEIIEEIADKLIAERENNGK